LLPPDNDTLLQFMPAVRNLYRLGALAFGALLCSSAAPARAQAPLPVFADKKTRMPLALLPDRW
jgi:hypothetical protein